ncbi:MAG: ATP-binding protein [Bacteroidales bacterium]|nr:ATP-binding protein [Bacteroidales bacterium]
MENVRHIVVTGPESTGKTKIASFLAERFQGIWVPEYARFYAENFKSSFNYADIESIAKKQVAEYFHYTRQGNSLVIFDTWLIITKVWFMVVYKKYPLWIDERIRDLKIDLYLLCAPDLEWKPDPARVNGGKMREKLFNAYEKEIKKTRVPYAVVTGHGKYRYDAAEGHVKNFLNL